MNEKGQIEILRGGAKGKSDKLPLMISQAIESAQKHGIKLIPGKLNAADGNCAFESVLHNINERECFQEKLPLSHQTYRVKWITDFENKAFDNAYMDDGFTPEEKRENWNLL